MLRKITMPSMGATMEEGVIVGWKVKEGDAVKAGEILLELESDKSTYEFESPCDGIIRKIIALEGQTVPVQHLIAVIGDGNEPIPADWLTQGPSASQSADKTITGVSPAASIASAPAAGQGREVKASPRARKLAEKLGVDLKTVTGTGPGGRIESADVEKAATGTASKAPGFMPGVHTQTIPFASARKQINRAVVQSKQQIPHFYVGISVDMTAAAAWREKQAQQGRKITYNALLIQAVAKGLADEPSLNYAYSDAGYIPRHGVNIGLAVETPQGVVIAVIENADRYDTAALSDKINADVTAAREERFNQIKMDGACMTISNLGMYRVETFIPIIHPGESAILGIGSIADRPVILNGQIIVRKTMPVTVCADHRIADGAVVARFLETFASYLEKMT
jgi:pyruvate dehydrogenase E2 component (dihydrolipoamide acetyltransferase)